MAKRALKIKKIEAYLVQLLLKVEEALDWVRSAKADEITLEMPEPFDHIYDHYQPGGPPCLLATSGEDDHECPEIAVLMGVFEAMRVKGKKFSRAKKKTLRSK